MMGTKLCDFAPLPNLSLEELVPKDNFYRRLQSALDLSFVRDLVEDLYAACGRPSVDPVVFEYRSPKKLAQAAALRPLTTPGHEIRRTRKHLARRTW